MFYRHHIRRAALRAIRPQPATITQSAIRFPTRSATAQSSRQVVWYQSRYYSEKSNASPAENEPVTSEPSAEEMKGIKEESIATGEPASKPDALSAAMDKVSEVAETVKSTFRGNRNTDREYPKEPSKTLYVGNLFFDLTPERLKNSFSEFGNIVNYKIVTDASGMSKG